MESLETTAPSNPLGVGHSTEKRSPEPIVWHTLGRDLSTFAVIATICLGGGLVINQFHDQPLPLAYVSKQRRLELAISQLSTRETRADTSGREEQTPISQKEPTLLDGPSVAGPPQRIDLAGFRHFVQAKQGVILDARPEIFHRLGHVPGALSLSREEFERDYAKQRVYLESKIDGLVAVYCSDAGCEDSQMVADALVKLGYRRVLVFKGGWAEWTQTGLPEEHP